MEIVKFANVTYELPLQVHLVKLLVISMKDNQVTTKCKFRICCMATCIITRT